MEKIVIVGTGDYAQVANYYLKSKYEIVCFTEERDYRKKEIFEGKEVIDFEVLLDYYSPKQVKVLVAVGPNKINSVRERLFKEVKQMGFTCIKYIHDKAYVWNEDAIGENSFIFPMCVIEPYAYVGDNCVMWSGASVAHHSTVKNHCFFAPGANVSGRTVVEDNCFIGINSTVRDNVVVKEKNIVGGGAVIKKSTEPKAVYSQKGTGIYNIDSFNTKV